MMVIRKAKNGYVLDHAGQKRVFFTLDDLMWHMLLVFEGRSQSLSGSSYGVVLICRRDMSSAISNAISGDISNDKQGEI